MLEDLEFGLFTGAMATYFIAWAWHLRGWQQGSAALTGVAVRILWVGWVMHVGMVGLRWVRVEHVPMLSAFEFVTFFAMLVVGCFLLFALKERNRMLGVFLVPVGLLLMLYAAWAVTFAASICYLYLERKQDANPGLFDQMAYRAAILAIVGFAALVFTYVGVDFLLPKIHGT